MSAKNQLQEIYQQSHQAIPSYATCRTGGPAHEPQFVSTVTAPDGQSATGAISNAKKKAETLAAAKLLAQLKTSAQSKRASYSKIPVATNVRIYIDLENLPNAAENLLAQCTFSSSDSITGFVSRRHALATKTNLPFKLIVAPTTVTDGADIWLCMYLAQAYLNKKPQQIIVLTKDHFGEAACQFVNNSSAGHCAHYFVSIHETVNFLKTINSTILIET